MCFRLYEKNICCYLIHNFHGNTNLRRFLHEKKKKKSSHPGGMHHLIEISAEWCISLCENKSFIWEWIHLTRVRSHFNASEISLRWDDFYPCKQLLSCCPNSFSLDSVCYNYYMKNNYHMKKYNSSYKNQKCGCLLIIRHWKKSRQ